MRILFLGDVVGKVGRKAVQTALPGLRKEFEPDFLLLNGENAAAGVGITGDIAKEFLDWGVDGITLGNHAFAKRDFADFITTQTKIVRPANFPPGTPGVGATLLKKNDLRLGVINLCGRIFMQEYDDPFRLFDILSAELNTTCIFVDFHAEATSEKSAFGWYVDGRASAVVGTHTHVQTADERILPSGTAFVTDVGMCGPRDSVIGMDKEIILRRFLTLLPERFEVAGGAGVISGVVIDVNTQTGAAERIERVFRPAAE